MPEIKIKDKCRFFDGSRPCRMNKEVGCECPNCDSYSKYKEKILIIKLDAIGDVLRTTCILKKIRERLPSSFIAWVTKPESIPLLSTNPDIDRVIDYSDMELFGRLQVQEWDYVYNLDNTHSAAALASLAKAKTKKGFFLSKHGIITPTNEAARRWLEMAVFDKAKRENLRSYQEIIYEICGFRPPISKPDLFLPQEVIKWADNLLNKFFTDRKNKPVVIGINTGSGTRWPKKMLDRKGIIQVIKALLKEDPDWRITLLGGLGEAEKNSSIVKAVNSKRVINIGCNYSVLEFSAIIQKCNVVLTADTLALHIASALEVPAVALFGPTSLNEIYDYNGLILKMATHLGCLTCYGDCNSPNNCMSLFPILRIVANIKKQINR